MIANSSSSIERSPGLSIKNAFDRAASFVIVNANRSRFPGITPFHYRKTARAFPSRDRKGAAPPLYPRKVSTTLATPNTNNAPTPAYRTIRGETRSAIHCLKPAPIEAAKAPFVAIAATAAIHTT